jgi:glycosyltransferase involved in cell wall biosynthesis
LKTILIFTDWYVPGFRAGGPIQSVYNLSLLLSKHFKVKVVCRDRDLSALESYSNIEVNTWLELGPQHHVMYLDAKGQCVSSIKQIIKDNKENTLIINGLYSFKFSILPAFLSSYFNIKNTFISVRGMLHQSALTVKPFKKQLFLAFSRGFGLYKKAVLLATNQAEYEEIKRIFPRLQIQIAPNIPMHPELVKFQTGNFKNDNQIVRFLFLGRLAPEKNPLAVLQAFQKIKSPCQVTFCGSARDSSYLETFKSAMRLMPSHIDCRHIDEVPHTQITEILTANDVMILPSLGENFGHAIFESFLHGIPVIIGNNTPWKNMQDLKAGLEVDPIDIEAIQSAIKVFLEMDPNTYKVWQTGAKAMAENYFNDNNFEELYLQLFS